MSYKTEFGDSFQLGFDLSEFPRISDNSWHNDECPRFEWDEYVLWVNDHDCGEFERYGVFGTFLNDDDELEIDYDVVHIRTDSVDDILDFLRSNAK